MVGASVALATAPHGAARAARVRGGMAPAQCGDRADGRRRRGAGRRHRLRFHRAINRRAAGQRPSRTLREIDALKAQGEGLNAAAITFDIAGGVALAEGVVWTLADRLRHKSADRVPRPLVAARNRGK